MLHYLERFRGTEPGPLFLTCRGQSLCRSAMRTIFQRLGREASVPKVHPHRFRHTFATWAIEQQAREIDVQFLLGHSTPAMLRRYTATYDAEKAAQTHALFSPADRLSGRLKDGGNGSREPPVLHGLPDRSMSVGSATGPLAASAITNVGPPKTYRRFTAVLNLGPWQLALSLCLLIRESWVRIPPGPPGAQAKTRIPPFAAAFSFPPECASGGPLRNRAGQRRPNTLASVSRGLHQPRLGTRLRR